MPGKNSKSKKNLKASALSVRIAYIIGGVLGFLLLFQMVQLYELRDKLTFIDELQDNQTKVVEQVNVSQNYLTQFATDLNQIREFLLLPKTDYDFSNLNEDVVFEEEENLTTQIFDLVTALGEAEERESLYQSRKSAISEAVPREVEGLTFAENETLEGYEWSYTNLDNGVDYLNIDLSYDGQIEYQMFHYEFTWEPFQELDQLFAEIELFENEIATIDILIEKTALVQSFYGETLFPSESFQNYLSENALTMSEMQSTDDQRNYYEMFNADGTLLATFYNQHSTAMVVLNKPEAVYPEETTIELAPSESEIERLLTWLNENLDVRTALQIKVEEQRIELAQLMEDRGFVSTMEALGMSMSTVVEEESRLYYSILNSEGEVLRNLVLDFSTGEVTVELPTGSAENLSAAIINLTDPGKKKTLDLPSVIPSSEGLVDDPSSFNLLLMGKHGSNVDTIIFANINSHTRKITLVSVPRDLWVDGQKINGYYGDFGLLQQVKTIESTLGHRIHKYILIDMYVFQDVIDLMGGVTVTLEEDLIDPTYKTCDNGVCSTLYYEAGEHHLDGTEALRIARSRYSTSDYSRAARQQIILEGIQEKAQSLGFGDANALISIMSTVLSSTETDISLDEATRYYFRYQNFDLNRGYVLSPANVLDAVPEPVDYVTSHPIEVCLDENNPATCTQGYALDTLQPKEQNWDLIPWFISSVL